MAVLRSVTRIACGADSWRLPRVQCNHNVASFAGPSQSGNSERVGSASRGYTLSLMDKGVPGRRLRQYCRNGRIV